MPVGTYKQLARAKMAQLIRSKLVTGCACGCRGDFELTAKGSERIAVKHTEGLRERSANTAHRPPTADEISAVDAAYEAVRGKP